MTNSTESDSDRTLWCGNVSDKITEELLYELFLQAGPLENVKVPSDKEGKRRNFGFILFKHACSVPYALKLLNGIRLHGRCLNLQYRPGSVHSTPPRGGNQQMEAFLPSPVLDARGLPLFNGAPNFTTRMGPPLPMQSLVSPGNDRSMGGIHRLWSAPIMQEGNANFMQENLQGVPQGGPQRDRSRDGRDREKDRGHDRDRSRDRHRDGRHRDRDFRARDYKNSSQDRDFRNQSQERNRNPSQDSDNGGIDLSLSRLRRGETYHGSMSQSLMGPVPQGLLGPGAPGDLDPRRLPQSGQQRTNSQRIVPPWQRPY